MYIFSDRNTVIEYGGEVLKRYVGKRLIKTISNPTDADLKEFGYMELIEDTVPKYNNETQFLTYEYEVKNGKIHKVYTVCDLETDAESKE